MNSIYVAIIGLASLSLGYLIYSKKVQEWLSIKKDIIPPSSALEDGVDYVPAKHWTMLFGHHFASIAGAAPIIGPVLACLYWGWLPALLWVVIGGIFFGAVHDYVALGASLENEGRSIGDLSESVIGKSAKVIFSIFVFLTLILIVAVFASLAGDTLAGNPKVVIPTFGIIPVAMIVGLLVYKTRIPLVLTTLVGIACLGGLIVLGYHFPLELPVTSPEKWWVIILLIYAMVASVLPVSILLQPRDHLSAGVLLMGMVLGFGGIAITRPVIQSPPVVSINSDIGMIWPMLFVTVACGAISGFHCLISSGTTSKQLPRIEDARPIGYGAMIAESALALLAIIAVTAGLYWGKAPAGSQHLIYQTIMSQEEGGGPIMAFGRGYGELTRPLLGSLGALVGIIVLKTFIMTTLDSATRITRYIATELFGDTLGIRPLKNRYVSTIVVGLLAGMLALSNWKAIWPIFGSANQLIAALVLIVATGYLVAHGRKWIFVAIPAIFVAPTAVGALIYKLHSFLTADEPDYMLATISILLIALGLFISARGIVSIVRYKKEETA